MLRETGTVERNRTGWPVHSNRPRPRCEPVGVLQFLTRDLSDRERDHTRRGSRPVDLNSEARYLMKYQTCRSYAKPKRLSGRPRRKPFDDVVKIEREDACTVIRVINLDLNAMDVIVVPGQLVKISVSPLHHARGYCTRRQDCRRHTEAQGLTAPRPPARGGMPQSAEPFDEVLAVDSGSLVPTTGPLDQGGQVGRARFAFGRRQ